MTGLLVAVLVLVSVTLVVLVVGIGLYVARVSVAVDEMAATMKSLREEFIPLADDVRQVLRNTDGLVTSARSQVDSVGQLARSVGNIVEGRTIVDAASKAVTTSRTTLTSVLEGVKEGLKALRSAKKQSEEESTDEQ